MNLEVIYNKNKDTLVKIMANLLIGSRRSFGDLKTFIDYKSELNEFLNESEKKDFFKLVFDKVQGHNNGGN